MAELEKVIRGLEAELNLDGKGCANCPYDEDFNCIGCDVLLRDALALLKAQDQKNKVLCQLLEWAIECDFGFDNIDRAGLFKKYEPEIKAMNNYTESLIWFAGKVMEERKRGVKDD